jgi:ABC-type uncharacterized transport system substrate-binding protein
MRWCPRSALNLPAVVLSAVILLALALCGRSAALAQPPAANVPRVFVVQSYNPEYLWTQHINEGLREALRGLKVNLEYFYMDAKRRPDPEALRQSAQDILRQIEAKSPQVVVTVDDAAQVYLAEPFLKGRAAPQVIFCGVNAPLALYGFPAGNVSGVRERWHFREGFALLKQIAPRLRSVAVLTDDSESSGYILENLREDQRQSGQFALKLAGVEKIHTFQDWRQKVLAYQKRADSLALGMYHSLLDTDTGRVAPPEEVIAWTNSVNKKPTLGFADYAQEHGLLCGVLESGREQGSLAGAMVRSVLEKGVRAGTLPVRINQKGIVLVNLRTAERLGLSIPYEIIEAAGVLVK